MYYGSVDGLVVIEFYVCLGVCGVDGRFYFGGVGGLVSFCLERVVDCFVDFEVFVFSVFFDG